MSVDVQRVCLEEVTKSRTVFWEAILRAGDRKNSATNSRQSADTPDTRGLVPTGRSDRRLGRSETRVKGQVYESEAGVLLTKQRKRMSPKVMKSWSTSAVRYDNKYRKWMERLGDFCQ